MDISKEAKRENRIIHFWERYKYYIIAFFIPFIFISASFAYFGVYPFGDEQIMNYDGWHQYYPFLMRLWDNVHGGNVLYDWSLGMGSNFLSLSSYYSASPLNLIYLLSPVRDNRILYTLLVCIRIGLSGAFAYSLLKKISDKAESIAVCLASVYALCGYVAGYYWNVMWLDGVALCPLICLGIIKLVREGKCKLYTVALFLALLSNYYIGYMCCIFSVIAFFSLCIIDKFSFKNILKNLVRFAVYSLIAGGMTMILLLPAFFGLKNTYSISNTFPTEIFTNYSFSAIISGMSDLNIPTVLDGLPNIWTGVVAVFLANAFLWAKKIRIREKIVGLALLIFLILAFNINVLDFIWHGFHFTNMLPARFAFIFSLVIIIMAYKYYTESLGEVDYIDIIGMILFAVLLAVCTYFTGMTLQMAVSVAVCSVLLILCTLYSGNLFGKKLISTVFAVLILAEAGSSVYLGVKNVGTTSYGSYLGTTANKEVKICADYIAEKEKDSNEIARTEEDEWYGLNDSAFFGYRGITQFSSAANVRSSRFAEKLGLAADAGSNRFAYAASTPLNNVLLGVKYIIARNGYLSNTDMTKIDISGTTLVSIYENNDYRGIGLSMPQSASEAQSFSDFDSAQDRQNIIFRAATGVNENYLLGLKCDSKEASGVELYEISDNQDNYSPIEGSESGYIKYHYTAKKSGMYYVYANVSDAEYMLVNNAWHNISEYPSYITAGYFNEGEKFTLKMNLNEFDPESEGICEVYVSFLDEGIWKHGLDKLSDEKFVTDDFGETVIKGHVDYSEDRYLYLSVPYESGWKAYVDGAETDFDLFFDSMCGLKLSKGHHEIELRYMPRGLISGAVISGISLVLFIILAYAESKGKKILYTEPFIEANEENTEAVSTEANNDPAEDIGSKSSENNIGEENDTAKIDVCNKEGT